MNAPRRIKGQSLLPQFQRFYAGSNHRIKRPDRRPTNTTTTGLFLSPTPTTPSTIPPPTRYLCILLMAEETVRAAKMIAIDNSSGTASGGAAGHIISKQPGAEGLRVGTSSSLASTQQRAKGKEIVMELGTEKEKKVLVWNMAKVRGAARVRFMAVGVFLSVLAISSKTLLDGMKRIWQIHDHLDTLQLRDRRFVLEFSEQGDFNHVTRAGPWNFRDDAVLVEELKEGEDPENFVFSTIPIWAQFQKIPFYLLSKELARELGREIGELSYIDNNSRGDICAKILRARVRIPINQALQRWITIRDGFANEDVIVWIAYERLPNFCRFCGMIGHLVTECRLPETEKKKRFEDDMGVAPTHPKDPRRWFLPEKTGQSTQHHNLPWRAQEERHRPGSPTPHYQLAIVAHVADEVGKLSMQEQPAIDSKEEKATNKTPPASPTAASKHLQQHAANNLIIDFSGEEAATTTRPASPTTGESEHLHREDSTMSIDNKSKGVTTTTIPPAPSATTPKSLQHVGPTTTEAIDTSLQKRPLRWKRLRKEGADNTQGDKTVWTTQGGALGGSAHQSRHGRGRHGPAAREEEVLPPGSIAGGVLRHREPEEADRGGAYGHCGGEGDTCPRHLQQPRRRGECFPRGALPGTPEEHAPRRGRN
ncbi:hypothetical protein QYE76_038205 [Lolium multiflorum]|uniref:CCHC-type domain-containing protein n=1 Tax=Lolium multiflorum TaxID=4521 RepID=A0AAD8WQP7_LOLMU|nr:hypothetical protein QYE76_038205 [Lolium multiflorum]